MPDNRQDELIALAEQRQRETALEALHGIRQEVEINQRDYQEALAAGRSDDAAHALRQLASLQQQAASIAPLTGYQQQQQQQAQPQQLTFTPAEQEFINRHPHICSDPRRFAELITASQLLQRSGYGRDEDRYIAALEKVAESDTDMGELTPDAAWSICQSKYGEVSVDEYNQNVQELNQRKQLGFYRNDRT